MAEQLAMRVDRAADEPSAVDAQQHPVRAAAFRYRPHRGPTARLGLDVVDLARFGGQVSPRLIVWSFAIWPPVGRDLPVPPDRLGLPARLHRVSDGRVSGHHVLLHLSSLRGADGECTRSSRQCRPPAPGKGIAPYPWRAVTGPEPG